MLRLAVVLAVWMAFGTLDFWNYGKFEKCAEAAEKRSWENSRKFQVHQVPHEKYGKKGSGRYG